MMLMSVCVNWNFCVSGCTAILCMRDAFIRPRSDTENPTPSAYQHLIESTIALGLEHENGEIRLMLLYWYFRRVEGVVPKSCYTDSVGWHDNNDISRSEMH